MSEVQKFNPEQENNISGKELFVINHQEMQSSPEHSIFVPSRDTGSANALLPVVNELVSENWQATILSDGPAKKIFEANFSNANITDRPTEPGNRAIGQSELILSDASSAYGMEGCASWVMSDLPFVLIEDNYNSSTRFVEASEKQYHHIPDRICVLDQEAKNIFLSRFPELADRVVVTGQPIYDKVSKEDTPNIQKNIKGQLGLNDEDKLVVFAATDEPSLEQYQMILEQLSGSEFYFGFRKHPYSSFSYEDVYDLMDSLNLKYVRMDQFTMDEAGAVADLVLTTWSTEGLKGVYRRKPTIHFLDSEILETLKTSPSLLNLPPVKLGASLEVREVGNLKSSIQTLLDPTSELRKKLDENMDNYYPADGKNTERVVNAIKEVLLERLQKDKREGENE